MSRHPEIVWAQRSEKVYLTVELPDAVDTKVNVTPEGKFTYSAKKGSETLPYEVELDLFEKINVEKSKLSVGSRHTFCILEKAEKGWWKRLLKAEGKPAPYIKVDWNKWVDEDEEFEKTGLDSFDLGGMNDFSNFDLGGGLGGLGDDVGEDDDEDDDEVEEPTKTDK